MALCSWSAVGCAANLICVCHLVLSVACATVCSLLVIRTLLCSVACSVYLH